MKYIIGNWKSNKLTQEVDNWFEGFRDLSLKASYTKNDKVHLVIAAPFLYISQAKKLIDKYTLPLELSSQDVSAFDNGAHTGSISAKMLSSYVQFVLIGHSERRKEYNEDDAVLSEKVKRAQEKGLRVIYCVQGIETKIPEGVEFAAYEPVWAIGSGKAESAENAGKIIEQIKSQHLGIKGIYGGSVTGKNIGEYMSNPVIDGVLPGGASLEPQTFWEMVDGALRL